MKKVIQAWALVLVNWPNDHLWAVHAGASLIAETSVPGASHRLPPVGCSFWKEPVAWVVGGGTSPKRLLAKQESTEPCPPSSGWADTPWAPKKTKNCVFVCPFSIYIGMLWCLLAWIGCANWSYLTCNIRKTTPKRARNYFLSRDCNFQMTDVHA